MSTDIHLFIEHHEKGRDEWHSFGRAELVLDGDYATFAKLVGVVNNQTVARVSAPRGMPADLSDTAKERYHFLITGKDDIDDNCVSHETASEWLENDSSEMVGDHYVTNPDAHTPTWLTPDELESALDYSDHHWVWEYKVLLNTVRAMEEQNQEVRVVFWFDN